VILLLTGLSNQFEPSMVFDPSEFEAPRFFLLRNIGEIDRTFKSVRAIRVRGTWVWLYIFSSPGPLVQVNYCHHLASVVCCLSSVNFSHFNFFSETTGPIGTKFSRNVPWVVLYKLSVFRSSRIFNMAARANNMLCFKDLLLWN
jgi:hypothetical protein